MLLLVRHNIDVGRANWLRKNKPAEFYITIALAEKAREAEEKRINKVTNKTGQRKGSDIDPKQALREAAKK